MTGRLHSLPTLVVLAILSITSGAQLTAQATQAPTVPALPPASQQIPATSPTTAPSQQAPQTATPPTSTTAPPNPAPAPTSPASVSPSAAQTGTGSAQTGTGTPTSQPLGTDKVFTLNAFVPEVNLVFTVTDGKGHFVTGLQQQNFGLLDDQKRPDRVISFTQQANLPLRIGILLDTSNSIRSRFQFEQQAATEFLLQVLRPKTDQAFVTGFDVRMDLVQDYTPNIDKLSTAIQKLRPGGGTAFYDAVYQTCRDQMLTLKPDTQGESFRKALIIVSDGEDNYSRAYEQDAIKMCQRSETIVYTISTNVSPSKDKGDEVLTRLSDATGGRTFFPVKIEDVALGFRSIEEELRSQYSLRYRPADLKQDGAFRSIYLIALNNKYKVRARKGYFAPRPPQ